MNALASFVAYVSVAFVQKILTSLNSTLPQWGQAVSVLILMGTYRSQSAFVSLSDSTQWYLSPAWLSQDRSSHSLDCISRIGSSRRFLIGEREHMGSQEGGSIRREDRGQQGGIIERINGRERDKGVRMLSGTYVGPPGADPLGGAPDIRHRKPREIVPQVSADASIKTR
ncbi:hypothetical protein X777_07128 [Ooceraea biroi]|uniref:Uncharacterized protein n=1 Tax=Ooceraea biroi TaxID=2015173 RepID=A0A026W9G3_OOCBI|nr:hypothetical protein X777_07128 [Ooceraea biroi]